MILVNKYFWSGVALGLVAMIFVFWLFIGKLLNAANERSNLKSVSVLSEDVVLSQDGKIIGRLFKGAKLYLGEDVDTITRLNLSLGFEQDAFPNVRLLGKSNSRYAYTEIVPLSSHEESLEEEK